MENQMKNKKNLQCRLRQVEDYIDTWLRILLVLKYPVVGTMVLY